MQTVNRTLKTKGMTIATIGHTFDPSSIFQLNRAKGMDMNVLAEPKAVHQLGSIANPYSNLAVDGNFNEEIANATKVFPKNSIPSYLALAITMDVYNEDAMIAVGVKHPVHIVFMETSETNGTVKNATSVMDVCDTLKHNHLDILSKGFSGRRITVTNSKELEKVLNTIEACESEIPEEVYTSIAIISWEKTSAVFEAFWQKFGDSITPFVNSAKEVLEKYRKVNA